jgi:NAD(P)-dependent dehydrogenase (short-subunit alcohol dehydrogenase family)
MSASFDFSGKRVFVFGGTRGINLVIARCFAAAGAVVAVASCSKEKVDNAVTVLNEIGDIDILVPGAAALAKTQQH